MKTGNPYWPYEAFTARQKQHVRNYIFTNLNPIFTQVCCNEETLNTNTKTLLYKLKK
jgi:hypothetical protein